MFKTLTLQLQKEIQREKVKQSIKSYTYIYNTYARVITWKQYNPSYNNITCVWSLLNIFPNILSSHNALLFLECERRLKGILKFKPNHKTIKTVDTISKHLFGELLSYTGANIILTNIHNFTIDELDVYDLINEMTPVVFTCMLSKKTAIIGCLYNEIAQKIARRCNHCMLTCDTTDHTTSETQNKKQSNIYSPEITSVYIPPYIQQRTTKFCWNKKTHQPYYCNSSLQINIPLCNIIEHSVMMKERQ